MSKEYEALKLEIYSLKRKVKRQKDLLIDIEWISIEGKEICLFCKGTRETGHADCELDKELDEEEV